MDSFHLCPMCGSNGDYKVKVKETLDGYFRSTTFDNKTEEWCCSVGDKHLTKESAQKEADDIDMEELNNEREVEALACDDEHGYFMDYGPMDSDPYDTDY